MRVLQINMTYKNGSTGKIMSDLSSLIEKNGYESFLLYAYSTFPLPKNAYRMSELPMKVSVRCDLLRSRLTGKMGYYKVKSTKNAIKWIELVNPDIIHLHNIHGDWINIKLLFEFIKKRDIPVVWTFHDCWPFTGRCSHFENINCLKWKTGCYKCKNKNIYPITYFLDYSKKMWNDKKKWFSNVNNLNIVTPSKWLYKYVEKSFLSNYPIKVINNGIDTNVFNCERKNRKKFKFNCDKKIILGVASSWTENKGLYDFYKINEKIDKNKYQIILVGLNYKQLNTIPDGIIGIKRTENIEELVDLYSVADVFVNPTYLDNYPTVNLEAIACGTPVVTYKTGGSPETIINDYGYIVEKGDIESLIAKIYDAISLKKDFEFNYYMKSRIDKNVLFLQYLDLYKSIKK